MKLYYGRIGFWIGTITGMIILALVMLEAEEQKYTIPTYTPSQDHQQIIDLLLNQKCELITYEQCINEPLDCHIDSRSPEGFTCRPY